MMALNWSLDYHIFQKMKHCKILDQRTPLAVFSPDSLQCILQPCGLRKVFEHSIMVRFAFFLTNVQGWHKVKCSHSSCYKSSNI